ncbi:GNAT family N-acetyltransferase [Trinickia acidisoli]|uniref:GNAT family N-acetyltransferase n=1 Tax=Trinickia acidisoli TaxID=2767482 RepID=UPI001A8C1641|nr:GNAT family N-acetyltransferase [Trinickia acidisoli]
MQDVTVAAGDWNGLGEDAARVRDAVFVRELRIAAPLVSDEADHDAVHVVAYRAGDAIAAARLLPDGAIGRLAVLSAARREGIGSLVLRTLIVRAAQQGHACVRLYAQRDAVPFYRQHGFTTVGESFYEAGVEHIEMMRSLGGPPR